MSLYLIACPSNKLPRHSLILSKESDIWKLPEEIFCLNKLKTTFRKGKVFILMWCSVCVKQIIVPFFSSIIYYIYICIFLDRDGHAGLTGLRARKLCPPTASPLFAQSNLDNLLFRYFKIFFINFTILYTNGSVNYVHRQPASFCTE